MKTTWIALVLALAWAATAAQAPRTSATKRAPVAPTAATRRELTVDWIMQGPALYGWIPDNIRWSRDSQRLFFAWKRPADPLLAPPDTYVVNRDGSALRKLSAEEKQQAPPATGELSPDKSATVFVERGDVYLYDHIDQQRRPLTQTVEVESHPRFWRDARHVTFVRGGNLYRLALDPGRLEQLTDIRPPGSPAPESENKGTESQEQLKKEQRRLLAVIAERAAEREREEAERQSENPRKPWILPARHSVSSLVLTPDGEFVIAQILEAGEKNRRTIVPNYVTESAYTEDIPARDKVGDVQGLSKLAVIEVRTGEWRWVNRPAQLSQVQFSDDGAWGVVTARALDNKTLALARLDWRSATLTDLVTLRDDAWVLGGGGSDGVARFRWDWLAGDRLWFLSERDGFNHLYTVSARGGEPKQITQGRWEVRGVTLSDDKRIFYLMTSEAGPAETHVYALSVDGGERKRITRDPGGHQLFLAPDGTAADLYGRANQPPELYLNGRAVTESPAAEFNSYPWMDPPIVQIPARDGAKIAARLYKPPGFARGGPMVMFVHGAGYLQNAHRRWSSYAREYLFHHLLADRGYLVLDLDYRGSAGYGRDWRTGIHRHMGGKDLDDYVDAVRWAVAEHGVDPRRVGIYGGSYGGFLTLMAMFTQPEVFACGAALRPVTDWAHYNHPYTANILDEPQKDPEAYRRSSPIYHAAGLKGHLLIAHGMVDVNVHYQDSVRLVQKLIELRKENWEFATYPVEDHGFLQPTSWADEYKRILKLFESVLKRPATGR